MTLLILKVVKKLIGWLLPTLFILCLLVFGALEFYVWVIYKTPVDGSIPVWIEFFRFHFTTPVPAA